VSRKPLLLDTGVLVALLDRREQRHEDCVEVLESVRDPILTTESVLTEAMHLLSFDIRAQRACLATFVRGAFVLVPTGIPTLGRIDVLLGKYADVPMDYADATLVALSEDVGTDRILTLDRRGFEVYRRKGRGRFRLLP
jgi:predicted nucleic acid-binding protein